MIVRDGGLIHKTTISMQELEPKVQQGVIAGFYGTYISMLASNPGSLSGVGEREKRA